MPKNNVPQCLNESRPVALTSLILKTFERVVKDKLLSMVRTRQFRSVFNLLTGPVGVLMREVLY